MHRFFLAHILVHRCITEQLFPTSKKMVITTMQIHYKKEKAKLIKYRNCKHFNEESFNSELNNILLIMLNNFFSSIVNKLGVQNLQTDESYLTKISNPITKAIAKEKSHPNISRIENYMKQKNLFFSFEFPDNPKNSKEMNYVIQKRHAWKEKFY